jgi:hypothetical protein
VSQVAAPTAVTGNNCDFQIPSSSANVTVTASDPDMDDDQNELIAFAMEVDDFDADEVPMPPIVLQEPEAVVEVVPGDEAQVGAVAANDQMQLQPVISMDILPPEILPLIFRFLPIPVRYLIQRVSRRWYDAAQFSIRKQEKLLVVNDRKKVMSSCQPHEIPVWSLEKMDRQWNMSRRMSEKAVLLSGLKCVHFHLEMDVNRRTANVVTVAAAILQASAASLTQITASNAILITAHVRSRPFVKYPAARILETDLNYKFLTTSFPNVEKLIIRALDIRLFNQLPASVTSIEAGNSLMDGLGRYHPIVPMLVPGNATTSFPWLSQLTEIRIAYPFTDTDVRTLIANPKLEVFCVPNRLKDLTTETISAILRSRQRNLTISDPKIQIHFETNDTDGTKSMTITESGAALRDISPLIQSSMSRLTAFQITHSLQSGSCQFKLSSRKVGTTQRSIELRSNTWTNAQFKEFLNKLTTSSSCISLTIEVEKLHPGFNVISLINNRFPNLHQLHITVNKYNVKDMDILLTMSELTDIKVRQSSRMTAAASAADKELEGMAVIEQMGASASTDKFATSRLQEAHPSTNRTVLKFDVSDYTADAVFFHTIASRNPYLQTIDLNICNFVGKNLSPLQELKHLKEVSINFNSKLPVSVEMLGSILIGWKNPELVFNLKTCWERDEVFAEIRDHKMIRLVVSQSMDWESHQSNNWPRLLMQFSSLIELELNGVSCPYNVISRNRRLKNLTWDRLDDDALVSFADNLPQLECVSCFENSAVSTSGLLSLLRGKARHCLRRIDVPMAGYHLNSKRLMEEVRDIQSVTNRKILLFIGE